MRKVKLSDLACLGGPPAFSEKLHVGRPNLGDRDSFFRRVNEIFDNITVQIPECLRHPGAFTFRSSSF